MLLEEAGDGAQPMPSPSTRRTSSEDERWTTATATRIDERRVRRLPPVLRDDSKTD